MNSNDQTPEVNATFSLEKTESAVVSKLQNSPEVLALKQQLNFSDTETVMQFGNETANEISQFADQILANIKSTNVEDSGELLTQLNKIMDKFDSKDFNEAPKKQGFFGKLMKNAKKKCRTASQQIRKHGRRSRKSLYSNSSNTKVKLKQQILI